MSKGNNMLIGAAVAAALAVAVYYGLISQQQASSIQGQANQALGTAPATQQPGAPHAQNTATQPSASPAAPASR